MSKPFENFLKPTSLDFEEHGKAWIVEEVSKEYDTWKPVIQALLFEDGVWAIRFGYYTKEGKSWKWVVSGVACFSERAPLKT